MLNALDFNYDNESWLELKEQHLPESYSDDANQFSGAGINHYSLLEHIHINVDSYFYLKYKSKNSIDLTIHKEYILPSSNELLTVLIPVSGSTIIESFTLSQQEKGFGNQILESGLVRKSESKNILDDFEGVIDVVGDMIILSKKSFHEDTLLLTFLSDYISEKENILIQISDTEAYGIKTRDGLNHYWFYNKDRENVESEITITQENAKLTDLQRIGEVEDDKPLTTDLEELIHWDTSLWRSDDYELFRWDLFPKMLIMDTATYDLQSKYFKRLAFFTEKKISAGELLENSTLEPLHGWNAHDYKSDDLARFFNEVEKQDFILNDEEQHLKMILLENGILKQSGNRVRPIQGGILSISRESSERLRWLFLTHECYHGLFFSSDEYVQAVTDIWHDMADEERNFWRLFLDMYGYNINDEYLLINEFQAYLMQQDISLADSYFRSKIQWILGLKPYLSKEMSVLLSQYGDTFSRNARNVENAAFSLTGIKVGDLVLKRKK